MIKLDRVQQITDIIHGSISYSGLENAIISSPIFNRLHRILQSSLVYMTFSSNKVKRFEHSIGTMYLAGKMFFYGISNSTCTEFFFKKVKDEILNWYSSQDFTQESAIRDFDLDKFNGSCLITDAPFPKCGLYTANFPENVTKEDEFAYVVIFQAIRLCGLLHDIGHMPYSHVFEYAAQDLYNEVKSIKIPNKVQHDFLQIMRDYFDFDATERKELHEEIGLALIKQIELQIKKKLKPNIENIFVLVVFYFAKKILSSNKSDIGIYSDLHQIISGSIDADRLDYCTRDLFCSGVRKDIFAYDRFLANYRLVIAYGDAGATKYAFSCDGRTDFSQKQVRFIFCPALKNLPEIEELLERRMRIMTNINYHHRVHKHEILFSEILTQIGLEELENLSDLPDLNPGKPLPLQLSSIWSLVRKLQENKQNIEYLIIQIDDSWMDTLLKQSFFGKYGIDYRNEERYSTDADWNKFDELISSSKHYYSLYKRPTDFRSFDETFKSKWLDFVNNSPLAHKFLDDQNSLISISNRLIMGNSNSNRVHYSKVHYSKMNFSFFSEIVLPQTTLNSFYRDVEQEVNKNLKEKNIGIASCILKPCKLNTGITVTSIILLWNYDKSCTNWMPGSFRLNMLMEEYKAFSPFHIYYLPKNQELNVNKELLKELLIDNILKTSLKYLP